MNLNDEHWGVIVNPYAGKRKLERDWVDIYRLLKKAEIRFDEQITAYPTHATEIARELVEHGRRHILVVGGDGTLNEVIHGIFTSNIPDKHNVTLALIPYGTGNDWARYWGIRRSYYQYAKQLFQRKTATVDVGRISFFSSNGDTVTHHFINAAGIGFDGTVVKITNFLKKCLGGSSWVYSLAVVLSVFAYKAHPMEVNDGKSSLKSRVFSIAVGNGCYSGGGLKQTPLADPTDGKFHITVIKRPTFMQIIRGIKYLFAGELTKLDCVETYEATQFHVKTNDAVIAETDGVILHGRSPFKIEIIPQTLKMVIP